MGRDEPRRITPFNPLDTTHLGESVAQALLEKPAGPLPPNEAFLGAGVYAIYYDGPFPLYRDIAELNTGGRDSWPIYVGKAVPAGARKGSYGLGAEPGKVLFSRLAEHGSSIDQVENLALGDFRCRFLVVDDIWIPLAESLLIETLKPIWNKVIDGFGNHDPGKGRYAQRRSAWDELHPGRPWAARLRPATSAANSVREGATSFLARTKPEVVARVQAAIDAARLRAERGAG